MNCESWYFLNKNQIEVFEAEDARLHQIIFESSAKTVRDAYYLETGKLKPRYIISKRRLMYLHHILTRNDSELIKKVYTSQKLVFTKHDWYQIVQQEKLVFRIDLTDEEISLMGKSSFKSLVNKNVHLKSFSDLCLSRKSKTQNIIQNVNINKHGYPSMQPYLTSKLLNTREKKNLFSLRSRDYQVKTNMKSMYEEDMRCRLCSEEDSCEDERHIILHCSALSGCGLDEVNYIFC